jgi:tRNA threonylcarbamoyladenosine biosynthesis protein TsaE
MIDKFTTHNQQETVLVGQYVANLIEPGYIVAITGDLGAGKTELIKGICEYFKVEDMVSSPTFTIINQYQGHYKSTPTPIYHIDLYRIKSPAELVEIGFEECLSDESSIKLIEWAERAGERLNEPDIKINILTDDNEDNLREIILEY